MTDDQTPLHDILEKFLDAKSKGNDSGNYRSNTESVLTNWINNFLAERRVTTVEQLNTRVLMSYTEYLARRVRAPNGIAASTAWTYYNYVSGFLSYAVKWEYLEENYAQKARVQEELPPRQQKSSGDQQFWSPEQRRQLCQYVDERAYEAIDERGSAAREGGRDRGLVTILAYTGARASEVFRSHGDTRREGITWADVDFDDGTIQVLGKSQKEEAVPLPQQAARPLEVWKRILDPPSDTWPVFPTNHRPSIYRTLRSELQERDMTEEEIETIVKEATSDPLGIALEYDVIVPSISTNGARSIMKRLTEAAGIAVEDGSYLKPHGGRRGVGEKFARTEGMTAAQRALRHADPKTTSEMYSHIEASDIAQQGSEIFDNE